MIRQATALSFYFIGLYLYFEKNKKYKLWGIVLYACSCLIHGTAIFTLPILVLLDKIKISKITWISSIAITYVIAAMKWFSVAGLLQYVFKIIHVDENYNHYANIEFGMIEDKGWFNMNLLPYSVLAILLLLMPQRREISKWYVQLFFTSVVLNNLFSDNLMWSRLVLYFSVFFIIAIPNMLSQQKWQWQLACYSIIFIYFPYKTISQLLFNASVDGTGNIIVPYESWLFSWFQ